MKTLKALSKGVYHDIIVDDDIYEQLKNHKIYLNPYGYPRFRDIYVEGRKGPAPMHHLSRFVLSVHMIKKGHPDYKCVDHINFNTRDNRRENLQLVSHQQNMIKSRKRRHVNGNKTSSKYKGVQIMIRSGYLAKPWISKITKDNKTIQIGCYSTEIEAAHAYNVEALKAFGKYAVINDLIEGLE